MKFLVAVSVGIHVRHVIAWRDEGHMLTAAVASRYVTELSKFQNALNCSTSYANFSTMGPAAVWLDHVQCTESQADLPWCQGLAQALGMKLFTAWQSSKQAYDPFNLGEALPVKARVGDWPLDEGMPTAMTALREIGMSWGGEPTSPWSYTFQLRIALHIWGDIHNPVHVSEFYDAGAFKTGDWGANKVKTNTSFASDLHAVWDTVGGNMRGNWPLEDFEARVDDLIQMHPPEKFIENGRLIDGWRFANASFGLTKDSVEGFIRYMVEDSRSLVPFVYAEWLSGDYPGEYTPSEEYLNQTAMKAAEQVALGGYRLASWLNYHSHLFPEDACSAYRPQPGPSQRQSFLEIAEYGAIGVVVGGILAAIFVWYLPDEAQQHAKETELM